MGDPRLPDRAKDSGRYLNLLETVIGAQFFGDLLGRIAFRKLADLQKTQRVQLWWRYRRLRPSMFAYPQKIECPR